MKHWITLFVIFFLSFQSQMFAQLPDGAEAPNWTLTDINGNSHTLYSLLNQGKMVVIEFSATWCGPCWNYMQGGALETFWDEHGPNGDNSAQVFYIESDWSTGMNDLLGLTAASQGNWVANIPFPIIDLPSGNQTANNYSISYYPTLYAVCHDHSLYELGQVPASSWSNFIQSCNMEAEAGDIEPALCVGEGSASVDVSGGFTPYHYHWSNGASTQTITGLASGNYHVTVTEGNGKISKVDVFVPGATTPVSISDMSIDPALCNGSANGNIYVDVEGGIPGYHYAWSNGSSGQDLHNVAAGNYTLTITDNNNCALVQTFVVDEPDELQADVVATPENCDQGDGTIVLSIEGGSGNYEVEASSGTVFGNQILDLSAGSVSIDVTDAHGCVWSQTIDVPYQGSPTVDLIQGSNLSCTNSTTTISGFPSGGYGDYTYLWTTSGGHIVSGGTLSIVTIDQAGSYTLKVTDIFSGCVTLETRNVQSNVVLPAVEAGPSAMVSCENLQVTAQAAGDPTFNVSWTTSTGTIASGGNTYNPVLTAPGTYFIHVINPATNCANTDSMIVDNGLQPATSGFQYVSSGLTINATNISTGSNVGGWNWNFGDGGVSTDQNVVHTFTAPGIYQVCLTVENGCGTNQNCQQVEVTASGSVILVDAAITNVGCYGESNGSILLTVNGGTGNYTYTWTGTDTTFTTQSLSDIPAGSYQLVITDDLGNIFINGYNVDQPAQIQLAGSTVTDNLCFGQTNGSVSLDISGGLAPFLYAINGSAFQPENTFSQLPGGIVTTQVVDANGCVFDAGSYTIGEPSQIQFDVQVSDVKCHGDANGAIAVITNGGVAPYIYLWPNGSADPSISNLAGGSYLCSVTDANGCVITNNYSVNEPEVIGLNAVNVTNASAANQNDGAINLDIIGGIAPYSVQWSNGGTGTTISALVPGEYTYSITDANGCAYTPAGPVTVGLSTGIDELRWPEYITVTPNPTKGDAVIKWSELPSSDATLSINTIDGKVISTHLMRNHSGAWELAELNLTEGLYIVLLKESNHVYPFKLIVL